jgi:hypothetical protein
MLPSRSGSNESTAGFAAGSDTTENCPPARRHSPVSVPIHETPFASSARAVIDVEVKSPGKATGTTPSFRIRKRPLLVPAQSSPSLCPCSSAWMFMLARPALAPITLNRPRPNVNRPLFVPTQSVP